MATYDYGLFDTAIFGTVANTAFTLFQTIAGTGTNSAESFTNMRGAGALPVTEKMKIWKIGVSVDFPVVATDVQKIWEKSFLDFRLKEQSILKLPLFCFADNNAYSGTNTTTAGANGNNVGLMGDGFDLSRHPIDLVGGEAFKVIVFQTIALSVATGNMKVVLYGEYDIP